MSLRGSATHKELRGRINKLSELRGYSAYDIAVINGFKGTEKEWLASLKGESGTMILACDYIGQTEDGGNIYQLTFDNGFTYTFVAPKGDTGEKGADGAKGETGAKIIRTEYIGQAENGDYIYQQTFDNGDTSTFNVPKGDKGDTGEKGEPGANGEKGANGADGYTPIKGIDYFTKADIAEIVAAVLAEITTPEEPEGGEDNTEGGYDESTGNLWGYWDISNINSAPEEPPFSNRFYFYGYVDGVYKEHVEASFNSEPGIRKIVVGSEEVYRYYYGSVEVNRLTNNTIGFGSEPQPIMTYQGDYMPDYGYTMWFVGFATPTTKPTV